MRRTQLYLDEQLWRTLHALARREKTTVSELVRVAARERYLGNLEQRRRAMDGIVGMRANEAGEEDAVELVRGLRRGARLERLHDR